MAENKIILTVMPVVPLHSTERKEGLDLQNEIEALYKDPNAPRDSHVDSLLAQFRQALNRGDVRAAYFDGIWRVNSWVKKALALCMRFGRLGQSQSHHPIDLDTLPRRHFSVADGVRVTDSTCFVRDGACISAGCTLMPSTVIQMGAFLGRQTTVGGGAGVGVCAQIGEGVQLGPGAQINGHIEPLDGLPAIIGDGASVGANCVIGTGVIIGPGALIFPGTVLLQQSRIYDPLRMNRCVGADRDPLVVPPYAIVIPGTRSLAKGPCRDLLLSVQAAVIAGYSTEQDLPPMLLDRLLTD